MEKPKQNNKLSELDSQNISTISLTKGLVDNVGYVESVMLDGKPMFLIKSLDNNEIKTKQSIQHDDKNSIPLRKGEFGYYPYRFTSDELQNLTQFEIKTEKILDQIKKMVDKYIVAKEQDKILITIDILITYCLEWVDTLHFPYFVGETESGKSSVLHLGKWLNYRCIFNEDIPIADVFFFLGTEEEGLGTICEDEAQEIWKDKQKIRMYKGSYAKGSKKVRIIMQPFKHQLFYNTFGPKWFGGETIPHDKGFRERLAIVNMLEGKPNSNIKRPNIEEKKELNDLRNNLLIWKIQQIWKPIDSYNFGLKGRDQELWEDFLAIVKTTKYFALAKQVVSYYTEQRHKSIENSLEARLFKIVLDDLDKEFTITFQTLWHHTTYSLSKITGYLDQRTKKSYYSDEFGKITPNSLVSVIVDKFQAKKIERWYKNEFGGQHKETVYKFDLDVIRILLSKYRVKVESYMVVYNILRNEVGQGSLPSESFNHVDHDDGLDKYV